MLLSELESCPKPPGPSLANLHGGGQGPLAPSPSATGLQITNSKALNGQRRAGLTWASSSVGVLGPSSWFGARVGVESEGVVGTGVVDEASPSSEAESSSPFVVVAGAQTGCGLYERFCGLARRIRLSKSLTSYGLCSRRSDIKVLIRERPRNRCPSWSFLCKQKAARLLTTGICCKDIKD